MQDGRAPSLTLGGHVPVTPSPNPNPNPNQVLEQTGGAKYSGPLDAARKTIAESGIWSLYNGLTAPLLGSMAECALALTLAVAPRLASYRVHTQSTVA